MDWFPPHHHPWISRGDRGRKSKDPPASSSPPHRCCCCCCCSPRRPTTCTPDRIVAFGSGKMMVYSYSGCCCRRRIPGHLPWKDPSRLKCPPSVLFLFFLLAVWTSSPKLNYLSHSLSSIRPELVFAIECLRTYMWVHQLQLQMDKLTCTHTCMHTVGIGSEEKISRMVSSVRIVYSLGGGWTHFLETSVLLSETYIL